MKLRPGSDRLLVTYRAWPDDLAELKAYAGEHAADSLPLPGRGKAGAVGYAAQNNPAYAGAPAVAAAAAAASVKAAPGGGGVGVGASVQVGAAAGAAAEKASLIAAKQQ